MLLASIFILLWSSGYIFVENGLQYSNPIVFLFLRLWMAWLIIGLVLIYTRSGFPKSWKQFFTIGITGIFAQGFYQVFFFAALYLKLSSGVLSIILGMQPLLTILISRKSIRPLQFMGILLGFIGLFLTVTNSVMFDSGTIFGICSALLSLCGITIGTILQKKYCSNIPISLTSNLFIQYFSSATMVSIICLILGNFHITWTLNFTISLLWLTFVISIASTYLFYSLLKCGEVESVSSYLYCVPPVTAVMDYVIFHHTFSYTSRIGMILVMCSLIMIHRKSWIKLGISS